MAAKLGSDDVSFRLGASTPAAVYLGAMQVWSAVVPRTLYFDGAVDGDWTELGNWWNDAGHTEAAASLPTAADSAVASASITAPVDYESPPAIAMLTVNNASLEIPIFVSGMATFIGSAVMDSIGQVNGNATFNDTAYSVGYVSGNATFNGNAENFYDSLNEVGGTVNGNATFNDSSINYSTVNGTATFNDSACNDGGTAGTFVPDPPPSC
jgi:hypothetical protein